VPPYKGAGGWAVGHNVPNEPSIINGLQTTPQGKADMDAGLGADSHQGHLIKACQTLLQFLVPYRAMKTPSGNLQGHENAIWKSRPGYLLLFYCCVWIVHE